MASNQYLNASGVYPHLALTAELGPPRSECGIGAMMAWAGKLWLVTYVSHKSASGVGTGLYSINEQLAISKHPASYVGTYTNRMVHWQSNQLIIGPHVIDASRQRAHSARPGRSADLLDHAPSHEPERHGLHVGHGGRIL